MSSSDPSPTATWVKTLSAIAYRSLGARQLMSVVAIGAFKMVFPATSPRICSLSREAEMGFAAAT